MVPFMDEVGEKMMRALKKKIKDSDGKTKNWEFIEDTNEAI